MDDTICDDVMLPEWDCPIYKTKIDAGLCWEISNIGNDELKLLEKEMPPCDWKTANAYCRNCQHYTDWE